MPIFSKNTLANFFKNTLAKITYFAIKFTFLIMKKAIWAYQAKFIDISKVKKTLFITKTRIFLFNTISTNSLFLISLIF